MTESSGQTVSGVVKFFNPEKGYGFARRDGGQDVFIHANEIRRSGIVDLSPIVTGQKLEFEVTMVEGRGPKATNIRLVDTPVVAASTVEEPVPGYGKPDSLPASSAAVGV